jgi:membrane-bound lytic murein transglycosylase F
MGHILDARNIARQQHLDPDKWSNLRKTLPLLSRPEFYEKAKYGYCRGTEAIDYINKINIYYDILKYQGTAKKD